MTSKTKRLLFSIFFASTSLLYFFLAYLGFKKQNIDLARYDQVESVIIDQGVDYHYIDKRRSSKCFYILLKGMHQKLGIYRTNDDYDDLLHGFNIGDTVKAYFINYINKAENINIDLLQIEKNGKVVFDKKQYERRQQCAIYLGLAGGIFTLIMSWLYYKRKFFRR